MPNYYNINSGKDLATVDKILINRFSIYYQINHYKF